MSYALVLSSSIILRIKPLNSYCFTWDYFTYKWTQNLAKNGSIGIGIYRLISAIRDGVLRCFEVVLMAKPWHLCIFLLCVQLWTASLWVQDNNIQVQGYKVNHLRLEEKKNLLGSGWHGVIVCWLVYLHHIESVSGWYS